MSVISFREATYKRNTTARAHRSFEISLNFVDNFVVLKNTKNLSLNFPWSADSCASANGLGFQDGGSQEVK